MNIKALFFICVMIIATYSRTPDWIKQTPTDDTYYIGIGSAPIKEGQSSNTYRDNAFNSALRNLSAAISVEITSSSSMSTEMALENDEIKQSYSEAISSSTSAKFSDYETVGHWESKTEYWVYVRLNKKQWHAKERMEMRKNTELAQSFIEQGDVFIEKSDVVRAIKEYLKAYRAIIPSLYLNPTMLIDDDDRLVMAVLNSRMTKLINGLQLSYVPLQMDDSSAYTQSTIKVLFLSNAVQHYLISISDTTLSSDQKGRVGASSQVTKNSNLVLTDWVKMFDLDTTIRSREEQWIASFNWPRLQLDKKQSLPKVTLEYFGNEELSENSTKLIAALQDNIDAKGFIGSNTQNLSAIKIKISIHREDITTSNFQEKSKLSVSWKAFNRLGLIIHSSQVSPISAQSPDSDKLDARLFKGALQKTSSDISKWLDSMY